MVSMMGRTRFLQNPDFPLNFRLLNSLTPKGLNVRTVDKPVLVSVTWAPHFLKLAPTLGSANSSKIHGEWRFHFFPKEKFLNLENTWTFISTVGILVSWKSEFTKNPTRIASVMEIFCTPLQCRVDLSMFHSSSISKIWHTST
jgi:hypothetical protein